MGRYFVKRVLGTIPMMFVVSILIFLFLHMIPGDPARQMAGKEATEQELVQIRQELGLNEEDYGFYLDLRKYGSTRHSGFGLGFERCVMYLTGMGNIRDVIPFPRTVNNCEL